ncbi:hypothetical protein SFRURICE_016642 [Spodoptera frugiperda]|nr:hypothetical protein SFRURICE_016642 [Spodoptera frugiperda]
MPIIRTGKLIVVSLFTYNKCLTASLVNWSHLRQPNKGFFRFYENFSLAARSLELCPVYGNRLTPYYMGLIIQMVKTTLRAVTCTSAYAYPFGDKKA